jgi:hypothetical protein
MRRVNALRSDRGGVDHIITGEPPPLPDSETCEEIYKTSQVLFLAKWLRGYRPLCRANKEYTPSFVMMGSGVRIPLAAPRKPLI